jgi:hypothetical protein
MLDHTLNKVLNRMGRGQSWWSTLAPALPCLEAKIWRGSRYMHVHLNTKIVRRSPPNTNVHGARLNSTHLLAVAGSDSYGGRSPVHAPTFPCFAWCTRSIDRSVSVRPVSLQLNRNRAACTEYMIDRASYEDRRSTATAFQTSKLKLSCTHAWERDRNRDY